MSGLAAGSSIVAIVLLAMLTLQAKAAQPSFDCDGAKAEVEKMICGDDALADLDLRLARDFALALARASANQVPELKASQRSWRAQNVEMRPGQRSTRLRTGRLHQADRPLLEQSR